MMMGLLSDDALPLFPVAREEVEARVLSIDPVKYGYTRNYLDGAVTYLSPYISRGVISTKVIFELVLAKDYPFDRIEKFVQELAWRDYWQQVWIAKANAINADLKSEQKCVSNHQIPKSIVNGNTGITAVDAAIARFYKTGYLHNHMRMYLAAMACNLGQSHWLNPARWMYYHLLDADWASNALSWQWVAGTNSSKKYYANQGNINKYCGTDQYGTFLDVPYDAFAKMGIPEELKNLADFRLETPLPNSSDLQLKADQPICIYNFYNLDPQWKSDLSANRILLLEPDHFEAYPVANKTIDFILGLGENIPGLQVFVGSFKELQKQSDGQPIYYKEHPLNQHYSGVEESRDWMFDVQGYFPSFFGFWKKCEKQLRAR